MRTITYALLALLPGVAQAQVASPPLTVDAAVSLAVKQNPRISAVAREIAAAHAGVRSARSLTNPQFTFTPALTPGGSDEELLLQQPLELNGTRAARSRIASAQLRQTQAEALTELRRVVFETQSAYFDLLRARELQSIAEDLLRSAEEFDRITRRQVEVGTRPGIDRTQTAIEVTRARQQVTLAESRVTAASGALNTLVGRLPNQPVGLLTVPRYEPISTDREALVQQALTARAEIAGEAAARDASLQEARLARAEGRPDLAPQLRGGNITRGPANTGVGLGITLPFLDYGSRRNRVRQAEETARARTARIEAAKAQVRQEVEAAYARLRASETVLASFQQGVLEQSKRLLEGSRTGFESGLTSVVGVLEAQRTYRAVLTDFTNALVDHAQARAELERATGSVSADLLTPATTEARSTR